MDVSRPATCLLNARDAEVLAVLNRSAGPLSIREVHRLASTGSYDGIRLALRRLSDGGLLRRDERGAGTFYALNREHLAFPALEGLLGLRRRLLSQAAAAIGEWPVPPRHASFFGSFARGDGDAGSDLDVLVVFDDEVYGQETLWADSVASLAESLQQWTGNRAAIMAMGFDEIRAMAAGRRARPLWKALRAEAITIYGEDLSRPAR